jgi:hypothetical protein
VVRNRPATVTPVPGPAPFNLAAALKKCKKKPKGKKRANCIKAARKRARTAAVASGGPVRHPWKLKQRPPGLPDMPLSAYQRLSDD